MHRFLDLTYRVAGYAAAFALLTIFSLVCVQVLARLLDGGMRALGLVPFGFIVPSIAEICGYLLAIASFLALAHTFAAGGHIRVNLLIEQLAPGPRRWIETAVGFAAAALAAYATVAVARLALKSWTFNDVSFGFVAVPLWLPQALMALGLGLLTVALVDTSWQVAKRGAVQPGRSEV